MRATEFITELQQPNIKPVNLTQKQKTEPINLLSMGGKDYEEMLHRMAKASGIRGTELAQFLAQCMHETADFSTLSEIGNRAYFMKRYDPRYNPTNAQRLGNTQPGDGERYKGRGFIQITGRDNYKRAGEALGIPLEQNPALAEQPDIAAKIAIWYWKTRVKPKVSNFSDTKGVTRWINSNLRGLQDRINKFNDYKNVFMV